MQTVNLTIKLNSQEFSEQEISGYCTDLTVAIKRLGLEVEDIKESHFSWKGRFANPYQCDKPLIREYLNNVNKELFKIEVR